MPEQTLQSVAFPTLSDAQIREFEAGTGAVSRSFPDGEILIAVGDRDFKFFIVKAGEIEILDHSSERPKTVTIHRKGEFTGDVSHLTGRASIISAVARGQCEASEVSGDALRMALNQCPTLSDIILQAFIARRQLLRESGNFVGLRVIGSRYSADTFRVRDFLAKNRILFTWLDVETHPGVHGREVRVGHDDLVAQRFQTPRHPLALRRGLEEDAGARPAPQDGGEPFGGGADPWLAPLAFRWLSVWCTSMPIWSMAGPPPLAALTAVHPVGQRIPPRRVGVSHFIRSRFSTTSSALARRSRSVTARSQPRSARCRKRFRKE
jgi:CRP-like cAMP-binding protein